MGKMTLPLCLVLLLINAASVYSISFVLPFFSTDMDADVTMTCQTVAGETFDGIYLPDLTKAVSNLRYVVTDGSPGTDHSLEIKSVSESDHGVYECRSKEGPTAKATLQIRVSITEQVPIQNIGLGGDGEVTVKVIGFPPAKSMTWTKDGTQIASRKDDGTMTGSTRYTVTEFGALKIKDVVASDAGEYIIAAKTLTNTFRSTIAVNVGDKPTFSKPPAATYTVTKGQDLSIPCELAGATGSPVWSQNKTDGTVGTLQTVGRVTVRPGVLEIATTEQSDEGQYSCSGTNDFGTSTMTAVLTYVIDPPAVTIDAVGPLVKGKNANLTCTGTGRPAPTIVWSKLGMDGQLSPVGTQTQKPGASVIMLRPVMLPDHGLYNCMADNGASIGGVAQTASENVTHEVMSDAKVETATMDQAFVVSKSETKTLSCKATGFPLPTITFMKDNVALTQQAVTTQEKTMLTVSINYTVAADGDLGTIVCSAQNTYGNDTKSIQLTAIVPPSAPVNIQADSVSKSSFSMKWQAPLATGNSAVTMYNIVLKVGAVVTHNITTASMTYDFSGLKNGTSYAITASCMNAAGYGPFSTPVLITTKSQVKPGKPKLNLNTLNVNSTSLPSTTLEVSWTAPQSSDVTYVISVCRHNPIEDTYYRCDTFVVSPMSSPWTKTNLKPDSKYRVSVVAKNKDGSTSESVDVEVTAGPVKAKGGKTSGLGTGAAVGIVIIILLIIFIIVDLCCCFFNNCGFSHCCFESCCSGRKGKYAAAEVGEEVMMDQKRAI